MRYRLLAITLLSFAVFGVTIFTWMQKRHKKSEDTLNAFAHPSEESHTLGEDGEKINLPKGTPVGVGGVIDADGKQYRFSPATFWKLPIQVESGEKVDFHFQLQPHQKILAVARDGGAMEGSSGVQVIEANDSGDAGFQYQVGKSNGNYRLLVNSGTVHQTFNFWIGPPLPPRVSANFQGKN